MTLSLRSFTNLPSLSSERVEVQASLRDKHSLDGPPFLRTKWTGSLALLVPIKEVGYPAFFDYLIKGINGKSANSAPPDDTPNSVGIL